MDTVCGWRMIFVLLLTDQRCLLTKKNLRQRLDTIWLNRDRNWDVSLSKFFPNPRKLKLYFSGLNDCVGVIFTNIICNFFIYWKICLSGSICWHLIEESYLLMTNKNAISHFYEELPIAIT